MKKTFLVILLVIAIIFSFSAIGCTVVSETSNSSSRESISSESVTSSQIISQSSQESVSKSEISSEQSSVSSITSSSSSVSSSVVKSYLITFKNGQELMQQETLEQGTQIVYNGIEPSKKADAEFTYTFLGWSKTEGGEVVDLATQVVTGEQTYYAIFSTITNEYTVKWHIGEDIVTTKVKYNDTPTKEDAYLLGYIFKGWSTSSGGEVVDLSSQKITGETEFFAVFTDTSVWDGTYPDVSSGYAFSGQGTKESPYLIESATDLSALSRLTTNKTNYGEGTYYKLTVNIDLSVGGWIPICDNDTSAGGWQAIGNFFSANFNGSNKTITFNETNAPLCFGLFMGLTNCTVENLKLSGTINGQHYHGALATYFNGGVTAKNITTNVNMAVSNTSDAQARTGGIVGQINGDKNKLINCSNSGNVTVLSTQSHVGGLVGFAYGETVLENCSNTGKIIGKVTANTPYGTDGNFVGELVGCGNGITFKVTFNIDGKESYLDVKAGLKPSYLGTPTKVEDAEYSYTFAGWSKTQNGEVTGLDYIMEDVTYYAIFTKTAIQKDALTTTEFYEQLTHYGSSGSVTGKNRIRTSFSIKLAQGATFKFIGDTTTYKWAINEMSAPYAIWGSLSVDSGWNTSWSNQLQYSLTQDCYPTIILARNDGANLTEDEIYAMKSMFTVNGTKISSQNTSDTLSQEEINSQVASYGSLPWQDTKTRARLTITIRLRKGAEVTFNGGSTYDWGVIETNNPSQFVEGAYMDSGWLGTATTYTTKLDGLYLILTIKKADGANLTDTDLKAIHSMFSIVATKLGKTEIPAVQQVDYEMKSVAHRGACYYAPENTLPAYEYAAKQGFKYVELDVLFTKDGIPVVIHDDTIDRTSNGSGKVVEMTLAELRQYDFGGWMGLEFVGTKIPTLEEFLLLCKNLNLHPYIEVKWTNSFSLTTEQAKTIVQVVADTGMTGNVSYISFSSDALLKLATADNTARVGWLYSNSAGITQSVLDTLQSLKAITNDVFMDLWYTMPNDTNTQALKNIGVEIEVWTVDTLDALNKLHPDVTGVSSNWILAGEYLENKNK